MPRKNRNEVDQDAKVLYESKGSARIVRVIEKGEARVAVAFNPQTRRWVLIDPYTAGEEIVRLAAGAKAAGSTLEFYIHAPQQEIDQDPPPLP